MATKKQKREAVEAKRQRRLSEERESGLMAQRKDYEYRENQKRKAQKEKHKKEHSQEKIERDCILCVDMLKAQHKQVKELETSSSE